MLAFYLICSVFLASTFIWNKLHTKTYGLFSIRRKRGSRNTLYMRPSECPTGDMVAAIFFIKLRKTLRCLQKEGRQHVDFETHIIRRENIQHFLGFLKSEGYVCESVTFRKTLLMHSATIKAAIFLRHRKLVKIHHESAQVKISLQ